MIQSPRGRGKDLNHVTLCDASVTLSEINATLCDVKITLCDTLQKVTLALKYHRLNKMENVGK